MSDNSRKGLPSEWTMITIAQVADSIQYGLSESAKPTPVGPKFLRITDLQNGSVDWASVPYCSCPPELVEHYKLRSNDVVFARTGATTGKSYLIRECPETVFASYLIRLRLNDVVQPKYFAWFLQSPDYWSQIVIERKGSAQPGVNASILATIKLPLAPVSEQHRIVAEIEKHLSLLDAGVVALKRIQANLKRYRASVLRAACEGRLVPTEAELARQEGRTYESADVLLQRILCERRARWEADQLAKLEAQGRLPLTDTWKAKYQEPAAPEVSDLPELPEGWEWATVAQSSSSKPNAITDGPFGSNLKTEHYTKNGPRVIRLQNIGNGVFVNAIAHISPTHFAALSKHTIEAGDIVIAAMGERPPRSCLIPEYVGQAIVKADCIKFTANESLRARYLNYALNMESTKARMDDVVHGIGRPRLNLSEIKAIILPIPPTAEQERIVAEVERRLSIVEEVEATVNANLKRAERLRQAILQRAFSGKLVPQDPADEPANVLLARIRNAHAPLPPNFGGD